MRKLILFTILFLFFGCKSTQNRIISESSIEKETIKDSTHIKEERVDDIYLPFSSKFNIPLNIDWGLDNKPFNYTLSSQLGDITVSSDDSGNLVVETEGKEFRTSSTTREEFTSQNTNKIFTNEFIEKVTKVKNKLPTWLWITIIISFILNYFLIRSFIRKKITKFPKIF